jgi:hypothetical protein
MIDVVEVLQHRHAGRPKSVVAASPEVDVKTVRKYVAPAEAAGLAPGGPAGSVPLQDAFTAVDSAGARKKASG